MKKINSTLMYVLFGVILLITTARLVSASNLPNISEEVHIRCYPLSESDRTYAVSADNRYIDPGDECYITSINGPYVYVSYPTARGRHSEWFEREAFTVADMAGADFPTITAPYRITTYRKATGEEEFGYLDAGDLCYVLTKTQGRTQLVYPVTNGYKMGWVDSKEIYDGTNEIIMSIHSAIDISKVLDVDSGSHADGTNILLYTEHGGTNQGFELVPVGNYFVIVNTESGKAIDVQDGISGSGVNVQLYTVNYSDAQQWEMIGCGDAKTYYIKNRLGYFLDVCDGIAADCTNIWVWEGNDSDAQKFKFKPLGKALMGIKSSTGQESVKKVDPVSEDRLMEKNVPDGIYTLTSALSDHHNIDVCDESIDSGANVQIWEASTDSKAQIFSIVRDDDGWYSIWNVNSGKVLDVQDAKSDPGTNIQQWENFNSNNQKFKFYSAGGGYYYIKSKIGNFIDVSGGNSDNGANLQLYSFNGTDSQKFKLNIQIREGICTISSALNDDAKIDINNANEENGTNIQLWSGNANAANTLLLWRYKKTSYFFIEKLWTSKELDVKDSQVAPETNVQLWDSNYDSNQQWEFIDAGDGYYYIKSALGNLYLDAYGGSSENGTNIQVYPFNGANGQKWRVDYLDYAEEINSAVSKNILSDAKNSNSPGSMIRFASYVKGGGKYDIKTKESWVNFFPNIAWITADGVCKYNNMLVTPEQLGNMVYGRFGKEWGYSCSTLELGGDVFTTIKNKTLGDEPTDHAYVELGYYHFGER